MDLKTSNIFKNLIPPLTPDEFNQLEANILRDGCREPIIVWNGYIVDGHNRYAICMKHNIPFRILEMEFQNREDVITWICSNQLGRRNISEETRKYLIGKRYDAEKIIGMRKSSRGINQYSTEKEDSDAMEDIEADPSAASIRYRTAQKIGKQYHLAHTTVQKYGKYARALDAIGEKEPSILPKILSGRVKVSHDNVLGLAELGTAELHRVSTKLDEAKDSFIPYSDTRKELFHDERRITAASQTTAPSIKDMPSYNPDSEVEGLTLTIPSWASSIDRVKHHADMDAVSNKARNELVSALKYLQGHITDILQSIDGGNQNE